MHGPRISLYIQLNKVRRGALGFAPSFWHVRRHMHQQVAAGCFGGRVGIWTLVSFLLRSAFQYSELLPTGQCNPCVCSPVVCVEAEEAEATTLDTVPEKLIHYNFPYDSGHVALSPSTVARLLPPVVGFSVWPAAWLVFAISRRIRRGARYVLCRYSCNCRCRRRAGPRYALLGNE
jgi:hypothetical protein